MGGWRMSNWERSNLSPAVYHKSVLDDPRDAIERMASGLPGS